MSAPDTLIIAKLLASAGLEALPSGPADVIQDQGGGTIAGQQFRSWATLRTGTTELEVALGTYFSVGKAKVDFFGAADASTRPPGQLGDEAGVFSDTTGIVVRKGAQVLLVWPREPTDPGTAYEVAKAVMPLLSGDVVSQSYAYVPAVGVDPCSVDSDALASGDIRADALPSVAPFLPGLQCLYAFVGQGPGPGARLTVYTLTTAQGRAAVNPVTPQRRFDDETSAITQRGDSFETARFGPLAIAAATSGPVKFVFLAGSDPSSNGLLAVRARRGLGREIRRRWCSSIRRASRVV